MTSSARRALAVLEIVNSSPRPIGVTAIGEAIGTLPGTAYRSLDALERCEFVARYRASTQYQMGAAARRLKQTLYAQFPLRNLATPFLRRLAYATSDTVSLTVPVGWMALRLVVVGGRRSVRNVARVGLAGPLDESPGGRVLLADFPEALLSRFLTEASPAAAPRAHAVLRSQLKKIARQGHADDDLPGRASHASVAVPVAWQGRTIAAVGIEGPVRDVETGSLPEDWPQWRAIISEIESQIALTETFNEGPFAHIDPATIMRALLDPVEGVDDGMDD